MRSLEICVADAEGAMAAVAGGADRLEVCAALEVGGLTPSPALVEQVLRIARPAGVGVHAMVRTRAGDFVQDERSLALALNEGEALVRAGCDGLVFGATRWGGLDRDACVAWTTRFAGRTTAANTLLELTFHRAIDLVSDRLAVVEEVIALGFDRILSSGGASSALAGGAQLRAMVAHAAGRCQIVAAAGVRADHVAELVRCTGVDGIHASASIEIASEDPAVRALGFGIGPRRRTSPDLVRDLRAALDRS